MKTRKRILKIIGYCLFSLVLLVGLGLFLLSRPAVQQRLTSSIEKFLEKKIGSEVAIERVFVQFPKSLLLEGVYVEDEQGDTLVFLGKLTANVGFWDLLKNKITVKSLAIENTSIRVLRRGGRSNFDFILEAFTQPTGAPKPPAATAAAWMIDIAPAVFRLENIAITLNDNDLRQFIAARIGNFEVKTDSADLPANRFVFKNVALGDSRISFRQLAPPKDTAAGDAAVAAFFLALRNAEISNSTIFYETTALQLDAQLADATLENATFSTATDGALALTAEAFQLEKTGNRLAYKTLPAPPPTPRNFNPGDFDLTNVAAEFRNFSFFQASDLSESF
ncbi:MAG: AsmA family protein, partial [Bacteroidota bacterium]